MNKETALLVIDMQNDFVEGGALIEVKGIGKNLSKFRAFIDKCRDKGILVVYTRHIFSPENNQIEAKLFPELRNEGLRDNHRGSEVHNTLRPSNEDTIIKKKRYDAFVGTDLELILRARGIKNLIITGTMTNVCCESTARGAMMKDFNVLFSSDLTFTSDSDLHRNTLRNIASHFGKVLSSEEIYRFL